MEDTKSRVPRDLTKRDSTERMKKWMPPQLLPDPSPEPGFSFRWIRTSTLNVVDPMNVSSKMREGWEPVKATDHPEIQMMSAPNSRFPNCIEVGGPLRPHEIIAIDLRPLPVPGEEAAGVGARVEDVSHVPDLGEPCRG